MSKKLFLKRAKLKKEIYNKNLPLESRFALVISLAQLPRNSAGTRVRNRCQLTGRPRGYVGKFSLSRNMVRDLGGKGLLPGVIKASW